MRIILHDTFLIASILISQCLRHRDDVSAPRLAEGSTICEWREDFRVNLPTTFVWRGVKKGCASDSQAPDPPWDDRRCDKIYFVRFDREGIFSLKQCAAHIYGIRKLEIVFFENQDGSCTQSYPDCELRKLLFTNIILLSCALLRPSVAPAGTCRS